MLRTILLMPLPALAVLAVGCADLPATAHPQIASASTGCSQLRAEITRTEDTKRTAMDKQQDAWKAVIPFVVAGRYVSGKAAVDDAEGQLRMLNGDFIRQGCVP